MSSKCPKCGGKLKATYLKQNCPHCGVNLLYYRLDERLEEDAKKAAEEVEAVNRFLTLIRNSSIKTPWHILRLILFFTPLASMCLPMYYAGHKSVSLIGLILSIVNHGVDLSVWSKDYLLAVTAMLSVIVLSLAVIIASLFSETKNGWKRNVIFSAVNTLALIGLSCVIIFVYGGSAGIGLAVTLLIYGAEMLLHFLCADQQKNKKTKRLLIVIGCLWTALSIAVSCASFSDRYGGYYKYETEKTGDLRVVSFNTAAPWGTPFDDTAGKDRADRFCRYMLSVNADLIGTQELNSQWLQQLGERLADYDHYAVKRGGDGDENTSEMNGIFWRKDRFTALETNTFWLSETPETESRFTYTDENGEERTAGCNRICSYAVLEETGNGRLIAFLNTHLDNACEEAVIYGAQLILGRIGQMRSQYGDGISIVLTGDFNQTSDGEAYRILSAVLNDTTDPEKEQETWQDWGYTDTGDKPIDFIFTSGTSNNYDVLTDLSEGYVSDHYGIVSDISIQ